MLWCEPANRQLPLWGRDLSSSLCNYIALFIFLKSTLSFHINIFEDVFMYLFLAADLVFHSWSDITPKPLDERNTFAFWMYPWQQLNGFPYIVPIFSQLPQMKQDDINNHNHTIATWRHTKMLLSVLRREWIHADMCYVISRHVLLCCLYCLEISQMTAHIVNNL